MEFLTDLMTEIFLALGGKSYFHLQPTCSLWSYHNRTRAFIVLGAMLKFCHTIGYLVHTKTPSSKYMYLNVGLIRRKRDMKQAAEAQTLQRLVQALQCFL